ncbi:cell division protein FtsQ/DivIB, partial [Caenispirillum bisanense]|uniref:cell division protein FtsQ/DivIB n=1 Tax=Caenispirillum bisanense TaxID=414052 RepID=UPI0031DED2EC
LLPRIDTRLVGVALLSLALSAGGAWLVGSGTLDRLTAGSAPAASGVSQGIGLTLNNLMVEGRNRTDGAAILAALNVQRGAPILDIDMQAAREALEALPWVSKAVVSRRLPDTLHVRIEERTPIALWQREDGQFMLTDAGGAAIPIHDVGAWGHLPVIVGDGAPAKATELFALLNTAPALAPRVKAATRRGDRRWDILLDDFDTGITVKLPEYGAAQAWQRFAAMERRNGLLDHDLAEIDLRQEDRVIVRLNGDGIPTGDRMKGGPKLKTLPVAAGAGREA